MKNLVFFKPSCKKPVPVCNSVLEIENNQASIELINRIKMKVKGEVDLSENAGERSENAYRALKF